MRIGAASMLVGLMVAADAPQQIAFTRVFPNAGQSGLFVADLFVMRADGSGIEQLTDNQWEEGAPAWRPRR